MGIYTKVADPAGDKWVEIGASEPGIEGLGDWATITAVSGDYKKPRHEYNDGVTDWVAYEWTDDGTITTSGGLVEALLVGGGSYRTSVPRFCGGRVNEGLLLIGDSHTITVGKGQQTQSATWGTGSAISGVVEQGPVPYPATGTYVSAGTAPNGGVISKITGSEVNYAAHSLGTPGGSTATNVSAGLDGVVVIRVPAAFAPNVQENRHGWDSFALVTDGVVTDVTRVPDNEPHTLDAEWLPCDAEVQAGWSHADGEFTPPPAPTRDDLIAELKERIKDLQKDK